MYMIFANINSLPVVNQFEVIYGVQITQKYPELANKSIKIYTNQLGKGFIKQWDDRNDSPYTSNHVVNEIMRSEEIYNRCGFTVEEEYAILAHELGHMIAGFRGEKVQNNLQEEKAQGQIFVTGNTVIDALHMVVSKLKIDKALAKEQINILKNAGYDVTRLDGGKKLVLITGHRRENFGDGFISMVTAMKDLSEKYPDVDFVYPMHLNPNVRKPIHEVFGEDLTRPNFFFIEPLQYLEFVYLMEKSTVVLTDSGGIQEEAPGLGKPVLVMRDTTERPEALKSGTVHLVGTNHDLIVNEVSTLLDDATAYEKMSKAVNPYGDGKACNRIVRALNGEAVDRYEIK